MASPGGLPNVPGSGLLGVGLASARRQGCVIVGTLLADTTLFRLTPFSSTASMCYSLNIKHTDYVNL